VGEWDAGEPAVTREIHDEAPSGRLRSGRQRVVREDRPLRLARGAARRDDECITRFDILADTQAVKEPLACIRRQTRVDGQNGVAGLPRPRQLGDEVVAGGAERDEPGHPRSMDCRASGIGSAP